ncbi:hydroxyacylglutathione hydrolase [Alkalimarinus sediminis]|uniref:Hydroxyacylglutathione hydrolase n=1 Tax=Alkalimarinus sediminis TaxID=1632866 RepID=A0A9E8HL09_9ALTE|nr:hydroxyacylglutathione hydrolase [Alkalimarinus sediminis]UZW76082.1 hydroxyacylglutathione hydrolase [Alkalimarinus sediminis]
MLSIYPIKAFQDNYIWCIQNNQSNDCVIVDPGDEKPVIDYITNNHLTLKAILITHHHYDHVDGVAPLLTYAEQLSGSKVDVFGPANNRIKAINKPLREGDHIALLGTEFMINEVPGHTLDHISYFSPQDPLHSAPWLFCGDTLFSAGCGRLFEGSPAQMLKSLKTLASYPPVTEVYCTHEYTLANLSFAQAVLPSDATIKDYTNACKIKRKSNQPTLPSTIATERHINPFLLCARDDLQSSVAQHAQTAVGDELDTFTHLRAWKDSF